MDTDRDETASGRTADRALAVVGLIMGAALVLIAVDLLWSTRRTPGEEVSS